MKRPADPPSEFAYVHGSTTLAIRQRDARIAALESDNRKLRHVIALFESAVLTQRRAGPDLEEAMRQAGEALKP